MKPCWTRWRTLHKWLSDWLTDVAIYIFSPSSDDSLLILINEQWISSFARTLLPTGFRNQSELNKGFWLAMPQWKWYSTAGDGKTEQPREIEMGKKVKRKKGWIVREIHLGLQNRLKAKAVQIACAHRLNETVGSNEDKIDTAEAFLFFFWLPPSSPVKQPAASLRNFRVLEHFFRFFFFCLAFLPLLTGMIYHQYWTILFSSMAIISGGVVLGVLERAIVGKEQRTVLG